MPLFILLETYQQRLLGKNTIHTPCSSPPPHLTAHFYLTAFADRFLMGFKKGILTPQGGRGGCRTGAGRVPRILVLSKQ